MDKFSALLKEAKPLYFARKRMKRRLVVVLPVVACCSLVTVGVVTVNSVNRGQEMEALYASIYDKGQFDKMFTAVDSVIAEMGLPVDEFGLLAASRR